MLEGLSDTAYYSSTLAYTPKAKVLKGANQMETRTINADQQQLNEQQEQAARELIETISMQVANQPPENIKEALVVDGSRCLVLYTDGTYMELQLIHAGELADGLAGTNILGSATLQ